MFYLRQPEDTIKGQMYYDLGYDDWVFEIEETTGKEVTNTLRNVWENYTEATGKVKSVNEKIAGIYRERTARLVD